MEKMYNQDITKYSQVGEPSRGWSYQHTTPNGTIFYIIGKGCNAYGNPTFHLRFEDDSLFEELAIVPSRERPGVLYKSRGYFSFTSYNVGATLKKLFKKCNLAEMVGLE